jgi:NhaP-type Na+/H+ or K+/H+ antiporter
MANALWFIIFGGILILMGLAASAVKQLPLTTSLLYLFIGVALGPNFLGVFQLNPIENSLVLERATEIVVIISLFATGLKLRIPWNEHRWKLTLRLAFISMFITVAFITLVGVFILQLPLGGAILLGGILAPTDPVLASGVQVKNPQDQDRLRFSLTGEAGFNDGTAFPFIMLGLGVLGLHNIGRYAIRWLLIDVIWAIPGGLIIGAGLGTALSHLIIWLRKRNKETIFLDDFLGLGVIALSYGIAVLLKSYGFLAVFAAGLALRRTERRLTGEKIPTEIKDLATLGSQEEVVATSPEKVPAYTAQAILVFNEQLERLGEVGMVVLLGGMVRIDHFTPLEVSLIPILFLLIRPVSVILGLWKSSMPQPQMRLVAWFGIRGIGSLYYLMYAIGQGLPFNLAQRLTSITLVAISASIIIHGITITPLMNFYTRKLARKTESKMTTD